MDTGSSEDFQMQLEQHQVMVIQLKEMIRERENQLQQKEKELQVGSSFNFIFKKPSLGFFKHVDDSFFGKLVRCFSSYKQEYILVRYVPPASVAVLGRVWGCTPLPVHTHPVHTLLPKCMLGCPSACWDTPSVDRQTLVKTLPFRNFGKCWIRRNGHVFRPLIHCSVLPFSFC